jgi:hypothetical protein
MADLPSLTDEDVVAIQTLLARYERVFQANKADVELSKEVAARLKEHQTQFDRLFAAFAVFGFERSDEVFKQIMSVIGYDRYWNALERAGRKRPPPKELPPPEKVEDEVVEDMVDAEPVGNETPVSATIRDLVLRHLSDAKDKGTKAAEIRRLVEAQRQETLHEKTIGMTLYRLSRDGLARRDGRTWFFVPPKAEAKNPGDGTPGSNDVFS